MAIVNELVTKFTFKGSLKPLINFQAGLQKSIKTMAVYTTAITAAATATGLWANATLRGSEALVRLSQDTDISIEKLQKMQFITAQNGVSTDRFTQDIVSLSSKIGEAATQGSDDFNRLGISVRDAEGNVKSADIVLGELTDKFKTLSQAQRISFAEKLGVDRKTISAFNMSDAQLKKLMATADKFGLVTEKQTKQLDNYYASIETLRFGFTAVSRQVALKFAPVLSDLSENITTFLTEFGTTYGTVFAEFFDGIGNLIGGFNTLIKATIGWRIAVIALGVAFAIAFPVSIIAASIGLLLTVVEDVITAFKGGKSLIASFFKDTFDIDIVNTLTDAFNLWLGLFNGIKETISSIVNMITNSGIFKTLSGVVGDLFGGSPTLTPLPLSGATNNNTTQTMSNDIKIDVRSNDPVAAGQAVSTALKTQLEQASFQYGKSGR